MCQELIDVHSQIGTLLALFMCNIQLMKEFSDSFYSDARIIAWEKLLEFNSGDENSGNQN